MKELVSLSVNGEFAKFIFLNEAPNESIHNDREVAVETLKQETHEELDTLTDEITSNNLDKPAVINKYLETKEISYLEFGQTKKGEITVKGISNVKGAEKLISKNPYEQIKLILGTTRLGNIETLKIKGEKVTIICDKGTLVIDPTLPADKLNDVITWQ